MDEPWIQIIEEPKQLEHRFRYKCEGNHAGNIPGECSTDSVKTSPTIKIHNMGPKAVVVVSCVSRDEPHHPHPHSLVGHGCDRGVCTLRANGYNVVKLGNVGIQCCKHTDIKQALALRREIQVDPFQTGHDVDVSRVDLNTVRLCFQAFLLDANRKITRVLKPVVTREIIDKKSFNKLEICRLSRQSAFAHGGDELMILCDKVKKGDIQVRFFEDGADWEAFGSPPEVHKQFAVTCKTPRYCRQSLSRPVSVWIQLFRPSDNMAGEPKPFQFIPNGLDEKSIIAAKKRKIEQRGINVSSNTNPTGSVPVFGLRESLLHEERLADPGAGLALMNVVGFADPSTGFSSLPPPYSNHADSYSSDEGDRRIVADLVDIVNNVSPGQKQVNLGNYASREVSVDVASHHGSFTDFASNTGQLPVNLGIHMPGKAELGTANHQVAFVNFPVDDQGQLNFGLYTSNEEFNIDVNADALVNDTMTSQQGFYQPRAHSTSQVNRIPDADSDKLLDRNELYPAGTIISITDDPVENHSL